MPQIPKRVVEIAQQLKQGEKPRRWKVKTMMKWFDAERRRDNVVSKIKEALSFAGITTDPDFATTLSVDDHVTFLLIPDSTPQNAPSNAVDLPPSPTPPAAGSAAVFDLPSEPNHVGDDDNVSPVEPDMQSPDVLEPETDEEPEKPITPVDARVVLSQPHDWTVSTLEDKFKRGKLNLQPKYQREYVWKVRPELPSRLIESLLLKIPIPPIYLGTTPNGVHEVIDGQQRLTTLLGFVRNEFPLRKLTRRTDLDKKLFKELPEDAQNKILDAAIHCVEIDAGDDADLRYEIFERLNRGSMILNEQELRNCVYRGPFNDLLAKLETDSTWRKVKGGNTPDRRFIEREMILRFFAFANRLPYYAGNLKQFLNQYMEKHAPKTPDLIKEQEAMFRQTMQNIHAVFGGRSAKLYNIKSKTKNGEWDTKFSIAVLDIQASALMGQPPAKVQMKAEQIRELFLLFLLTNQGGIQEAISRQTAGSKPTKVRWTLFRSLVQPILDGTEVEPRFFEYSFRKMLYDKSRECKLCHNEIHSFEDSTVDHITPYSKNGKTIPENAQLAHRNCNAIKHVSVSPGAADGAAVG